MNSVMTGSARSAMAAQRHATHIATWRKDGRCEAEYFLVMNAGIRLCPIDASCLRQFIEEIENKVRRRVTATHLMRRSALLGATTLGRPEKRESCKVPSDFIVRLG